MGEETLQQRIRRLSKLTKSEMKIAELFEREYHTLAFETLQTLSSKAGVGLATMGRFINKLGYRSFPEFIESTKNEVLARLDSPIEQYTAKKNAIPETKDNELALHVEYAIRNLMEMRARIAADDIKRAASLIAESKGTLYVMGAASSQGLAYFFHTLAMYFKDRVVLLDSNPSLLSHRLIDVSGDDVLVAIMHYRFSTQTVLAGRYFSRKGGKLILVSDREFNPLSASAAVQLVARSESPSMFNSRCGTLLILETLIAAVIPLLEQQVYERFAAFENLSEEFGTFAMAASPSKWNGMHSKMEHEKEEDNGH